MKKSPILLLGLLFLFACAGKTVEVDVATIDTPSFLTRVRQADKGVRSIKGLAYVSIKAPENNASFSQVTIAEEPNLLRLEALAPFGRTAVIVISDGERVHVISQREHRVFDSLEEFDLSLFYPDLPVRITVDKLVDLLLGRFPGPQDYDDSSVRLSKESSYVRVAFTNDKGAEDVFWVNPVNYRIEKAKVNLDGEITAAYSYGDFKDFGAGASLPTSIKLKLDSFSISIRYHSGVEVNTYIDRGLFEFRPSLVTFEKK